MEKIAKDYQIRQKRGALVFRTSSYNTDEGSALHSGIYNRELTASLAAGAALVGLALLAVYLGIKPTPYHYLAALLLFVILIYLFRVHVFFEKYLELTIDKDKGSILVFIKSAFGKPSSFPLINLKSVNKGITILAPENPDGMEVVRRIALQHNMVMSDFGQSKEVHFVDLEFDDDRTVMVFASDDRSEVNSVADIFVHFMGGGLAKKN